MNIWEAIYFVENCKSWGDYPGENENKAISLLLESAKREQRLLDTFDREAEKVKQYESSYRRIQAIRAELVKEMEQ